MSESQGFVPGTDATLEKMRAAREAREAGRGVEGGIEQKETEKPRLSFDISFDPAALDQIESNAIKAAESPYESQETISIRQDRIREVMRTFKELPPLSFKSGATLIFGPNGGGKSTLAKTIRYAMDIERTFAEKEADAKLYGEEFDAAEAREYAVSYHTEAKGYRSKKIELAHAGLAPELAKAVRIMNFSGTDQKLGKISYEDCAATKSEAIERDHKSLERGGGDNDGMYSVQESQRQTIDKEWKMLQEENENAARRGDNIIRFIDEPETGMDPWRQQGIESDISALTPDGSVSIIPTNSYHLMFNSDLPRIDMKHPERGIHRPSEYPRK